jgi:hemerythrin-like domain-containing protein
MDFKKASKDDPLNRSAEKQTDAAEYSPMSPPDPYSPPAGGEMPYEDMPPYLQKLMDDHRSVEKALAGFEETLTKLREQGLTPDKSIDEGLRNFFSFLDEEVVRHHQEEEKYLLPLLHERLLEKKMHSQGNAQTTAVDMLEDDHVKTMQLAVVTFSFLGLSARLPDPRSRAIVLDAALEQGLALIELLRLHIFREDKIVFPLASECITSAEFEEMQGKVERIASATESGGSVPLRDLSTN